MKRKYIIVLSLLTAATAMAQMAMPDSSALSQIQ